MLGLVPLGTANDFANAARHPAGAAAGAGTDRRFADRSPSTCSGWSPTMALMHWCANLASGGFGTQVTVETDEGLKKMLGGLAYLITGISRLGRIEPIQARLRGPDFSWEGDFIALGIGNGRQAGGGQALCPDALDRRRLAGPDRGPGACRRGRCHRWAPWSRRAKRPRWSGWRSGRSCHGWRSKHPSR